MTIENKLRVTYARKDQVSFRIGYILELIANQPLKTVSFDFIKRPPPGLFFDFFSYFSVFRSLSKTLLRGLTFWKRTNTVCDVLEQNEKQFLCDKIIRNMIENEYGDVFLSFMELEYDLPPIPEVVNLDNPYSCVKVSIKNVGTGLAKRMFWCKSRLYIRGGSSLPIHHYIEGVFCAGSRQTEGRVFVFRVEELDDRSVYVVGEMDNVGLVAEKVAGVPAIDDSPPTSSSSSSSELF